MIPAELRTWYLALFSAGGEDAGTHTSTTTQDQADQELARWLEFLESYELIEDLELLELLPLLEETP